MAWKPIERQKAASTKRYVASRRYILRDNDISREH